MAEDPTWLAEHKGRFLRTEGYVWECGDDECGCTQAVINDYFQNRTDPRWRVPVGVWAGSFFTDHEPGADEELAAERRRLRADDPDREAAIRWQEGVDYDAAP